MCNNLWIIRLLPHQRALRHHDEIGIMAGVHPISITDPLPVACQRDTNVLHEIQEICRPHSCKQTENHISYSCCCSMRADHMPETELDNDSSPYIHHLYLNEYRNISAQS